MNNFLSRNIFLQVILVGLLSTLLLSAPIPQPATRALYQARLASQSDAPKLASEQLAKAASYLPWQSDLLCLAGRWSLQAGDPQASIDYINQISTGEELPPDCLLSLGEAYQAAGYPQKAVEAWQMIPESAGYSDTILTMLLGIYQAEADYLHEIEVLKSIYNMHPNESRYSYRLGLLLAVYDPEASQAYLSQAGESDPALLDHASDLIRQINTARLYDQPAYTSLSVGRWMASQEEWRLAELAFRRAIELRPDFAEAWAYLGESLQHIETTSTQSTPDKGYLELQTALQISPDSVPSNVLMSFYWQRQSEDEKALEYLERALKAEPDNPILLAEYGRLKAILGDLITAQEYYEQAAEKAPNNPTFWRLVAEFSLDHQVQVRQIALPAAGNVIRLAPDAPQSLDLMGKTLIALGELEKAEEILLKAIELDDSYASAHLHLGLVYLNQGNVLQAQREFDIAERLAPDSAITDQITRLYNYYFP